MNLTNQNKAITIQGEPELTAKALVDQNAFATLFDQYFPLIHKYVLYRVNNPMAADDVTAEVFERMFIALHRYNPAKAPFGAWLFGIARHAVNDHHRKQKRNREVHTEETDQLIAKDLQPEEVSQLQETDRNLLIALQQLSDREKDIIGLKFAAELTNRQIAKLIGLGESHVGVILYRSMQHLRLMLTELEECDER
ncbi:MAG: RNA polymerase subunit sigma-24 [Anaerolinea sp.]|nr:RNA polymerase subunit sigma-24 [Anaerolinea sp.]